MMRPLPDDTIVALITPPGTAGIAMIRISGPQALPLLSSCFVAKRPLEDRRVVHGWLFEGQEPVDEVLVTYFKAPRSYTGEEVVEIHCHGGMYLAQRILEMMVKAGARPARPGEFTQRAFLHGKIDLTQAEAVADLIQARSEAARRAAVSLLKGRLSERIDAIRNDLITLCGLLELELDFAEEDVLFASREDLQRRLAEAIAACTELLATYDRGRICREGFRVALTGRPNVGKSCLLNALLERERAIVTEIPGTTRDVLEETVDLGGILILLTDGAGLRETADPVEYEGVRRAESQMWAADLVVYVLDGSLPLDPRDEAWIHRIRDSERKILLALNKIDLPRRILPETLHARLGSVEVIPVSAKTGEGVSDLRKGLREKAFGEGLPHTGEVLLTRARHYEALAKARGFLMEASEALQKGMSQEFIAVDLRGALEALGEITGETTTDDILNGIFSSFCIGK